ncbi:metalloproteinase inhibitor 3-like [Crassostrea angulata]|uniref:metalloproteinase inhibitor 3-like n=1 Tax=Magallana angulata TaxID=2784310 RepID=UPI0022B0E4E2|nr:metalloproteinase inhibitor 3-like [Crassostrea angulata]
MRTFWILFAVLSTVFTYSKACRCAPKHQQVQFCSSDFVIRAKVFGRTETGSSSFHNVYFTVRIFRHYKKGSYREIRRVQRIYTAPNSAGCGENFEKGREYIISGTIYKNKWITSTCNWNVETSLLPQYQRNALKFGYYSKQCSCDIDICLGGQCSKPSNDKCVVGQNGDYSCFFEENSCRRGRKGCTWHTSECLRSTYL